MDFFDYKDGRLWAEDVDITANIDDWGTPCYVYSRATFERHWKAFDTPWALNHILYVMR